MRFQALILVAAVGLSACTTTGPAGESGGQLPQASTAERRDELEPRTLKFITEVAAQEPAFLVPQLHYRTNGLPPTWQDQVCAQVTGLPEPADQFILARVAQIARAAGVRLGSKHCSPNFYIFVTTRPRELIEGMQESFDLFGTRGRPYLIDQFSATPRAVRVWYNVIPGRPASLGYEFARVLLIADRTKLQAVSLGQLADYIAMVGLAEIVPDAHLGDARTILKLFDAGPQVAPAGLSDWDQAFLKALYSTLPEPFEQYCGVQRCELVQIAQTMASDIDP
jgi:hypothetical protein